MQQVLQTLKTGAMELAELPNPIAKKGEVLVRTHFSAISTGTEGKAVSDARKGYLAKAKSRQTEVTKVIQAAKLYGLSDTYAMVMNKLEALHPLGYSLSGVVMEAGQDVYHFSPGDRVACAGSSASHAELVCVPENLCVKIPDNAPLDQAAFTTIGAIAMQGIRRAGLKLGENCAVIGLGLIGQLTIRLLKAAGIKSFGIDLRHELLSLAKISGAASAALRSSETLLEQLNYFSNGHGVDAVIITAATSSTDPVELAGTLCRQRGKVVIVGNVPTGFSRKEYYRKELDLLMSTSYGPGRYDSSYEEKGLDYPIGQVRWTENRNMQAFAELLDNDTLHLHDLISHRFPFDEAKQAFDLVVDSYQPKMGVLLEYNVEKAITHSKISPREPALMSNRISLIGAGSFASNFLLPNIPKSLKLMGVATSRPHTAENVRRKHGFEKAYSNIEEMLSSDSAQAVMIATRHESHAPIAMAALKAGKRVFLEKPLCISLEDYFKLKTQLSTPRTPDLMLGFNRRFAPAIVHLDGALSSLPVAINYRINAGALPSDHWALDPDVGGGRIIGEVCHYIDLCSFIARSRIKSVSGNGMNSPSVHIQSITVSLAFENGSVASISYFSNGSRMLAKEYLEVFSGGTTAIINDFRTLKMYGKQRVAKKLPKQDKGHAKQLRLFTEALLSGTTFPISVDDALHSTLATFALVQSLKSGGQKVDIKEFEASCSSQQMN